MELFAQSKRRTRRLAKE